MANVRFNRRTTLSPSPWSTTTRATKKPFTASAPIRPQYIVTKLFSPIKIPTIILVILVIISDSQFIRTVDSFQPSGLELNKNGLATSQENKNNITNSVGNATNLSLSISSSSRTTDSILNVRNNDTTILDGAAISNATDEFNATTSAPSVLISNDEFVDFNEAPTLLFDGLANDTSTNANESTESHTLTTSRPDDSLTITSTSTTPIPETTATTTAKSDDVNEVVISNNKLSSSQDDTMSENIKNATEVSDETEHDSAADTAELAGENENNTDTVEKEFEVPKNISEYMDYIEKLFRDLRHQITDLFEPHIPQLIRTSQSVELSSSCSFDMLKLAFALRKFEPWALKMIDSSGKVPEGIFEGSFTALGSYDECLNVVFDGGSAAKTSSADSSNLAEHLDTKSTQGKYCLVTVSPFLPPKPPMDKVDRLFQEEANRRNYTRDDQFSRLSPMFYYMKFRIGVCVPSTCEQSDMDSISNALSTNLRLNITIPDCRVKQTHMRSTSHQLVAGAIFASVFALVVASTMFDCFERKSREIRKRELEIMMKVDRKDEPRKVTDDDLVIKMDSINDCKPRHSTLTNRLQENWYWLSFSLITSFKLYFKRSRMLQSRSPTSASEPGHRLYSNQMINCLDGIRVLSLCWVIVANSYLTLDPRATKRLTKTREAPKDFIFQIIVQASLAIETFFFLSGLLMSLSFSKRFDSKPNSKSKGNQQGTKQANWKDWLHFYIHRYVRMTPATMLVIAFSMYGYQFGDGPIWFEATKKAHESCSRNWWRHMLHIANYIDTRQMCFIHYWYISADMQLFLFAPILLFLVKKYKYIGYSLVGIIASSSIYNVFYTTYTRNLPPTLLFYSSDPESRREFGNTIMTKPMTHVLPYMVGMIVGQWLSYATTRTSVTITTSAKSSSSEQTPELNRRTQNTNLKAWNYLDHNWNLDGLMSRRCPRFGTIIAIFAIIVGLAEVFLPYKWNNSNLPSRMMAALYASLFRLTWSLVLAIVVISCAHVRSPECHKQDQCKSCKRKTRDLRNTHMSEDICDHSGGLVAVNIINKPRANSESANLDISGSSEQSREEYIAYCYCGDGGNLVNRLLGLRLFTHLSKLSFVAYLIHLPLMSVFVQQTRGLFAFSHTLVVHLAISYLVLTFVISFALVHIIEFPFITFERLLFVNVFGRQPAADTSGDNMAISNTVKVSDHNQTSDDERGADYKQRRLSFSGIMSSTSKCYYVSTANAYS